MAKRKNPPSTQIGSAQVALCVNELIDAQIAENPGSRLAQELEDLKQQVCLKAIQSRFYRLNSEHDVHRTAKFLIRQGRRDFYAYRRAQKRDFSRTTSLDSDLHDVKHALQCETRQFEDRDRSIDVENVLAMLGPDERKLVDLLKGLSVSAAARRLGLPRETVRDQAHRIGSAHPELAEYLSRN